MEKIDFNQWHGIIHNRKTQYKRKVVAVHDENKKSKLKCDEGVNSNVIIHK